MTALQVIYLVISILAVVGTFGVAAPAYTWNIIMAIWIAMTSLFILGVI